MKVDVYEIVTDRVIELLERGTVPWRKPWKGQNLHPCNGRTGSHYRGINPFLLEVAKISNGYRDHRWLTFKQAKDAGGTVKKGESSSLVVFWKWLEKADGDTGEVKRIPLLRYFRVFNVEQCKKLDESKLKAEPDVYEPSEWEAIENAERIADTWLESSGLHNRISHGGNRAAYSPSDDSLLMPDRDRFEASAEYYSTLFHELTHSTGHIDRLNRFESGGFGSDPYAREELIAELGAAFLCGECGIESDIIENSAAYLNGWIRVLKGDKRLIASAAGAAQKAADLILGRKFEAAEDPTEKQPLIVGSPTT